MPVSGVPEMLKALASNVRGCAIERPDPWIGTACPVSNGRGALQESASAPLRGEQWRSSGGRKRPDGQRLGCLVWTGETHGCIPPHPHRIALGFGGAVLRLQVVRGRGGKSPRRVASAGSEGAR